MPVEADEDVKPPLEFCHDLPVIPEVKIKEEPDDDEDIPVPNSTGIECNVPVKEEDLTEHDIQFIPSDINIYENIPKLEEETKNEDDSEILLAKDMTLSDCEACTVCSKIIPSSDILAHHDQEHADAKNHRCRLKLGRCPKQCASNSDAPKLLLSTLSKPYACHLCWYSCYSQDQLQAHSLFYHDDYEDVLQCPHCPYRFRYVGKYQAHLKRQHLNPPHKCTNCDFATTKKYDLARHRSRSEACRPYACSDCNVRFSQLHALAVHRGKLHKCSYRFSTKRIRYVCPLGCKSSYFDREKFYEHVEKIHQFRLPEVEFSCFTCEYKCHDQLELKAHYTKTRHNMINHCSVCTLKFVDKVKFAKHFRECAEARRAQAESMFAPDSILVKEEVMDYDYDNDGEIDESIQDPNAVGWMGQDDNEHNEMVTNTDVSDLVEIKAEPTAYEEV